MLTHFTPREATMPATMSSEAATWNGHQKGERKSKT